MTRGERSKYGYKDRWLEAREETTVLSTIDPVLKKKLKKAGHVAVAATELEKGARDVKDRYGKTKGETLRGAQGRDKKRQMPPPKANTQRAASNKTNLIMAAKMC